MAKAALVLGLGLSGESAARLLMRGGTLVTLADAGDSEALRARAAALGAEGASVRLGRSDFPEGAFDLCVLSPGIPSDSPWAQECRRRGIPVLPELELGWRHLASRVLAVTGSNGKSTLVKLCCEALRRGGLKAETGANYGTPLSALAMLDPAPDWVVAEVSSFQLETTDRFAPDVGILLNLNPNHLDRHGTMDVYTRMKARLFRRMKADTLAVIPEDAPEPVRAAVPAGCRRRTFGLGPAADCRYASGRIEGGRVPVEIGRTAFDNEVMGVTAAACVAAVEGCGVDPRAVGEAARAFERLPHRMQTVAVINGVSFVNDSKATNLAAMSAGLRMAGTNVRLIAGGLLKERDLDSVKKILVKQVRSVYVIGKYSQEMASAWQGAVPCAICRDLKDAVCRAWKEAKAGETILLSPGCASFDQFRSFEDRGEQFVRIVSEITKEIVK